MFVESPFETRQDVVDWGLERGLLNVGEKPETIIERVKDMQDRWGYSYFKAEAVKVILDSIDRKKRGKYPASTGSFEPNSVSARRYIRPADKESKNPREYLQMVIDEFVAQVAFETRFITDFVENNDRLTDNAKKLLVQIVSASVGPWYVPGHVTNVYQDKDRIIVEHKNGAFYYYVR